MYNRCRQEARNKFASLRTDVLEKIELLESKHVQDLTGQLKRMIDGLKQLSQEAKERLQEHSSLFPIEVDLKEDAFLYKATAAHRNQHDFQTEDDEDEGDDENDGAPKNVCNDKTADAIVLAEEAVEADTKGADDLMASLNELTTSAGMATGAGLRPTSNEELLLQLQSNNYNNSIDKTASINDSPNCINLLD